MLAYPTPTFDAKTILQAPGFRPIGKSSGLQYEKQPEAVTAPSIVNRRTANGGYVGSRSSKFIQNNQFNTSDMKFNPMNGTPLSQPGSVGNVDTQAIGCQPKYAEPKNGELQAILNILNGKPNIGEAVGRLSAKQISSLEKKGKPVNVNGAKKVVDDFSDAREALRKENMIKKAISQGFSAEEAKQAYNKLRIKEAETALMKEEDPSVRLYDLIDSKVGGTQDGSIRSNDETGLYLAKGANAVLVKQAEKRNAVMDKKAGFDLTGHVSVGVLEGLIPSGRSRKEKITSELAAVASAGSAEASAVVEAIAKRRGRPKGAKDVNPRIRPSGLVYKRGGKEAPF